MNQDTVFSVVTTIREPTPSIHRLLEKLRPMQAPLVVAGDAEGPHRYDVEGAQFLPLADQWESPFSLARRLPTGHYSRKNIAYLWAISRGASCIYETDDDNAPNDHWKMRSLSAPVRVAEARPWLNVYRLFSDALIWPRGFPLDRIHDSAAYAEGGASEYNRVDAPIQQGLADKAPDVDAIWRLVLDRPFYFDRKPSVWLPPGTWCPFNSQTTWWWPLAFPLLYLPSYCSFRMTDVWRSFVAQRCLWETGHGLVFHAPDVSQDRNEHDVLRDFRDEVPGYVQNTDLVTALEAVTLQSGPGAVTDNLLRCYETLVTLGVFPAEEMRLVSAWTEDLEKTNP